MADEFVLVVEDDQLIGESLVRALLSQRYTAVHVTSLAEARREIEQRCPALVLLDVMLPDGDGVEFCSQISTQHPALPIVMLTARTGEIDIVVGLQAGAVDYITKPFRLAELFARVASHLRFAAISNVGEAAPSRQSGTLVIGRITIDPAARRVFVDDSTVDLRPKEFDLLLRLAIDRGSVVTREQLIADVWDENWWGPTKTLDVHINALRRKLGTSTGSTGPIATIRGVGYRMEEG